MPQRNSLTPSLRPMNSGDFAACVDLWKRCDGVVLRDWEDSQALDTLLARNPGGCWVVEQGRLLLGAILCGHDGWRGYVYHLAVDPDWHRAGLGTGMVHQALNYFSQQRIRRVHVLVNTENLHGHAFWRAVGATLREDVDVFTLMTSELEMPLVQ